MSGGLERGEILATVRRAVRGVVERSPELRANPGLSRTIAERMVGVSMAAAELLAEDARITEAIARRADEPQPQPLAEAAAAGDEHRRTAVDSAAGVMGRTRDAIDFPGFVTSLITGVFQSIQSSSIQQLQAVSDLLEALDQSAGEFGAKQITAERAAEWIASRWSVFVVEREDGEVRVSLRADADMPDADELARALEASKEEVGTVDESELAETLIPLVRRKLARARQAMLSTMVLMGLQRVVVDDGRLHASMRLQVDARSVAEQTQAERTDTRFATEGSASFGMGAWGASAKMSTNVGYVSSDEKHSKEDIGVQAGLRSSVDLRFHTEPVVTDRLASQAQVKRLEAKSMVPDWEQSNIDAGGGRKTKAPKLGKPPSAKEVLSTVADPPRPKPAPKPKLAPKPKPALTPKPAPKPAPVVSKGASAAAPRDEPVEKTG